MIDRELFARIRQLFYAEHWKVGTIATELGVHHDTVEKTLYGGPRPVPPPRPSALDPYMNFLRETLKAYPRLTSTRLHRMLCERGYTGSARQVRHKVAGIRPRHAEAFLRRRTYPGEESQTDWGSFGRLRIGRAERRLSCFVKTLTYSRNFYLEFFLDQILESFLAGYVHAFEDFAGVARRDLVDNLRSAVLERHGQAVHYHPRLLELAAHYHFEPRACAPARGNEKGAVERTIRYIRESFFAARTITTLARLNQEALVWRNQVALERPWPGGDDHKTVAEAFAEEKRFLLPLPKNPFDTDRMISVRSRKTIYIRFDCNDYSIPPDVVGEPLCLVASATRVRLLRGTAEIAEHRRSYERHQRVEDPAHIEALLAIKRGARGSVVSARLLAAVPESEEFLEAAFHKGESVAQHTDKLLLLLDDYGAGELRAAMHEALQKDTPRLASVAYILAKRRRTSRKPTSLPVDLSRRPDLKDLYVKPHDSHGRTSRA